MTKARVLILLVTLALVVAAIGAGFSDGGR
jgi:hypothetical protein